MNDSGAKDLLIDWKQFDSVIPTPDSPCIAVFLRFGEVFAKELEKIQAAWKVDDKELARFLLHQLRGSSGSFGLADLANRIGLLEEAFQNGTDLPHREFIHSVENLTNSLRLSCQEIREQRGIGLESA